MPTKKEVEELYELNKTTTFDNRIENSGGASDVFEATKNGRVKSKTVHSVYKKHDSVDDMAKSTLDLLTDASRQAVKEMQKQQNNILSDIVSRNYVPRRKVEKNNELDAVMGSIRTF